MLWAFSSQGGWLDRNITILRCKRWHTRLTTVNHASNQTWTTITRRCQLANVVKATLGMGVSRARSIGINVNCWCFAGPLQVYCYLRAVFDHLIVYFDLSIDLCPISRVLRLTSDVSHFFSTNKRTLPSFRVNRPRQRISDFSLPRP